MRETEQLPCQDARLRDEHQNMFIMPNMHDDQHATCMINIFSGAGGYLASISLSRLHRVGPNFELVCTTYSLDVRRTGTGSMVRVLGCGSIYGVRSRRILTRIGRDPSTLHVLCPSFDSDKRPAVCTSQTLDTGCRDDR